MSNMDRRNQKTVWDILPALAVIGSLVTAWVNLNGTITQLKVKQGYNTKLIALRLDSINKKLIVVEQEVRNGRVIDNEMREQINDLERSVTQLYNTKRNNSKRKK